MSCKSGVCLVGGGIQPLYSLHSIEFCYPVPGIRFNPAIEEPPRGRCGDYMRNLGTFPLNKATIEYPDRTITFGGSEMVLPVVIFNSYPRSSDIVRFGFYDPNGRLQYEHMTMLPYPDNSWSYGFVWAVIGRFTKNSGFTENEIVSSGNYRIDIETPWENVTIKYQVR